MLHKKVVFAKRCFFREIVKIEVIQCARGEGGAERRRRGAARCVGAGLAARTRAPSSDACALPNTRALAALSPRYAPHGRACARPTRSTTRPQPFSAMAATKTEYHFGEYHSIRRSLLRLLNHLLHWKSRLYESFRSS